MTLEPVILVHGTFAQDSDWIRRDGVFCKTLNDQLKQKGSMAECWSHLTPGSDEFRWSGANSDLERRLASWNLLDVLLALELRADVDKYHIISHSHGGNVVLRALGLFDFRKLRTVTFLGCPFIETRLRIPVFRLSVILIVALLSLAFLRPDNQPSFKFFAAMLITVASYLGASLFGSLVTLALRYQVRRRLRRKVYRCFAMHSKHDEAYAALVATVEIMNNPGYYAKMLMRRYAIFPNMAHWRVRYSGYPWSLPFASTNRLFRSYDNVFRYFSRIMDPLSSYMVGVVLSPFTLAMHRARYLGVRIGLNAIAALATGNDFSHERIRSVVRRPSSLMVEDLEIPTILDEELKDQAVRNSSDMLHGIYASLAAPMATNITEVVRRTLVDPYLVHSQYYKHERLICQIACAISGNESAAALSSKGHD